MAGVQGLAAARSGAGNLRRPLLPSSAARPRTSASRTAWRCRTRRSSGSWGCYSSCCSWGLQPRASGASRVGRFPAPERRVVAVTAGGAFVAWTMHTSVDWLHKHPWRHGRRAVRSGRPRLALDAAQRRNGVQPHRPRLRSWRWWRWPRRIRRNRPAGVRRQGPNLDAREVLGSGPVEALRLANRSRWRSTTSRCRPHVSEISRLRPPGRDTARRGHPARRGRIGARATTLT